VKDAKLLPVRDRVVHLRGSELETWRAPLASLVCVIHTGVVVFFVLGWALPWRWALWTCTIGAVVMRLHWWMNDDVCMLTQLERRLRGDAARPAQRERFIARLLRVALRRSVPDGLVDWATHGILWTGAGLASLRLLLGE
jgi:hypothetical protein